MSRKSGPYEVVRNKNVSIPIYRSLTARGYEEFKVVWRDSNNARRFKTFSNIADARQHAEQVNASIRTGDIKALSLTEKDRVVYLDALNALTGISARLDEAVRVYADSVKRLGSVSIKEAVEFYLKHNRGIEPRKVSEVVLELYQSKKSPPKNKKPASAKYLADLDSRLGKFADAFNCNIGDVRPEQIAEFLNGLPNITGRTWFNYARLIRTLMNFAQSKRYYPTTIDPLEGIDIEYEDDGVIEIFTPEELGELLSAARDEMVPFIAIGAFAGVRHAEIGRLDWKHISETHVEIEARSAKTRARRIIPIQPNLSKWLAPYRKKSGPVAAFANTSKQLLWLSDKAGVDWKHNALRHSFVSYRLAQTNDENLVAVEAGNSPTMIQHHYRQIKDHNGRVITPALADAWFSIEPTKVENVVPMKAA